MRKIETVKIELDQPDSKDPVTKEFTVKELTCQQIIDLTQTNSLFGSGDDKKSGNGEEPGESISKGLFGELADFRGEAEKVMKLTCDFTMQDLKPLAPSEIKLIFEKFKKVNSDFLEVLEKLKITAMYQQVLDRATNAFSKMFVPSLNQDT